MKLLYEDMDRARKHARRTVKEKRQRIESYKENIEVLLTQLIDDEKLVEEYDAEMERLESELNLNDDPFKEESE